MSVYVDRGVRRGLNLVTSYDDISAEEFIKISTRDALAKRGLPIPEALREPEPATAP